MAKHKSKTFKKKDSKNTNTFLYLLVLGFFFISGTTGLIYEILWTRLIVKIIGSAPFAVSIVLTVFMGGLGLGSYLASRTIDRIKNPGALVKLYGILELIIGIYGILLPFLLMVFRPVFGILYNHLFAHFFIYTFLAFIGCTLLLILPVICMGATLPVLSRFYVTRISHVGTNVGRLYGINTVGGAAGSLLCGFWILYSLGVWGSLIFAVILNVIIGLSCGVLSSVMKTPGEKPKRISQDTSQSPKDKIPEKVQIFRRVALIIFAVSGFCAMAYEVIWTKLLGLIIGPTTYSFTIVLVTFISGLAVGSMFFGWLADKTKKAFLILLATQISAALAALFISQIMGNSQIFFAKLIFYFRDNFTQLMFIKSSILFLFLFFPTFFLGATFPLVGKIYTYSISHIGKSIGFAYSINTVGAVLGSFCAGFVLIPFMGKENSLSLIISMQLLTSLCAGIYIFWKTHKRVSTWIPFAVPALLGILLAYSYPQWQHKWLATGKYDRFNERELSNIGWLEALGYRSDTFADYDEGNLVYFGDGIGGFTTVIENTDIIGDVTYSIFNSGKADASTYGSDMYTQTLLAHFPMLFHKDPKTVFVLGLASGITAGEVLCYPVEKLDIVEINRQVITASNFFASWNSNVLSNPKTELIIQDARAHMELTDRTYDVIISEPSNPWMAGLATLFTCEFFDLVREKLNKNGIFCQWIHAYQMDWNNFSLIGRTFTEVFPNSLMVTTGLGLDYLLIGFEGNNSLDSDIALHNLTYARKSENMNLRDYRLFYTRVVSEDLQGLFGQGPLNTDNRPRLEFSAPKLMYIADQMIPEKIMSKARISEETEQIIQDVFTDVDAQIDFADYTLTFKKPLQDMVDLSRATPSQRERFSKLLEEYCSSTIVEDFSFLKDEELKNTCVSIQIETVLSRVHNIRDNAPVLYHLGNLYYEKGMPDKAIAHYSDALKVNPEFERAHYNSAKIFFSRGNLEEAIYHCREEIRINPYNIEAHNSLGNMLGRQGNITDAIRHFNTALSIDPESAVVHKNLGIALKKLGKTSEGDYHLREAMRLSRKAPDIRK